MLLRSLQELTEDCGYTTFKMKKLCIGFLAVFLVLALQLTSQVASAESSTQTNSSTNEINSACSGSAATLTLLIPLASAASLLFD